MTDLTDLTELRGALDDRADALDTRRPTRAAELRGRVRGVRRRRRAAAGAGLAAVVAVVAGVAVVQPGGPDDRPDPAEPVVGLTPPESLDSLGYGYELAGTAEAGGESVAMRLGASDTPRLVSWATSGADQRVRVRSSVDDDFYADAADYDDWVLVPPGAVASVSVRARSGQPRLAYYDLGSARPAGVTEQGVTFRDTTADGRLLAAAIGAPGEADVTTAGLVAPGGRVSVSTFCAGGPAKAYLHVATGDDGEVVSGPGCDGPTPVDGPDESVGLELPAGADLTTRLYVTAGPDGPPLDDPDLQVGVGVYDGSVVERREGFATYAERGGHRYRLQYVTSSGPGEAAVQTTSPADRSPVLVRVQARGGVSYLLDLDGETSGVVSPPATGGATGSSGLVTAGRPVAARVRFGQSDRVGATLGADQEISLGFYVRDDGATAEPGRP